MSDRPFPALIFAAGFGARMKALTQDRPKPLIEVSGRPLVDYALALAQEAGCEPIAANLHYKAEMLDRHLAPKSVKTIVERPKILETGGGLRNALPILGAGPVVTLNSDAIWKGPNPVKQLMEAWRPEVMDALLMCVPTERAEGHEGAGDFTLGQGGQLNRGPGWIYGGVQIFKTDVLEAIDEEIFSLNLVWDRYLTQNRLFGLSDPGRWCDVGHPAGITLAEELLEAPDV